VAAMQVRNQAADLVVLDANGAVLLFFRDFLKRVLVEPVLDLAFSLLVFLELSVGIVSVKSLDSPQIGFAHLFRPVRMHSVVVSLGPSKHKHIHCSERFCIKVR